MAKSVLVSCTLLQALQRWCQPTKLLLFWLCCCARTGGRLCSGNNEQQSPVTSACMPGTVSVCAQTETNAVGVMCTIPCLAIPGRWSVTLNGKIVRAPTKSSISTCCSIHTAH